MIWFVIISAVFITAIGILNIRINAESSDDKQSFEVLPEDLPNDNKRNNHRTS